MPDLQVICFESTVPLHGALDWFHALVVIPFDAETI